jgi:hypothetical protein
MNLAVRVVFFNGLWLIVPAMIWNMIFAAKLPRAFSLEVFWRNIPPVITIPENTLRMLVFIFPSVTLIRAYSGHRRGYVVFALGTVIYFVSWLILIYEPQSAWSRSAVGFLAPAYTPLLWLIGIALITESYVGHERMIRSVFLALSVAFLAFHIAHATLIYRREYLTPTPRFASAWIAVGAGSPHDGSNESRGKPAPTISRNTSLRFRIR